MAQDQTPADQGVASWVWWLLGAVVLAAGALGWVLGRRGRRRRAWRKRLAAAESDLAWLARELLPELRAMGSFEGVAGGWRIAQPRVVAAEDELTALGPIAPSPSDAARARVLRDGVRECRLRLERVATAGAGDGVPTTWARELDEAIGALESALAARSAATDQEADAG